MKYTAPRILNILNAKGAIKTEKEASPSSDQIPNFVTPSAYHSDE